MVKGSSRYGCRGGVVVGEEKGEGVVVDAVVVVVFVLCVGVIIVIVIFFIFVKERREH